ncbi:acetyl-CoA carboxylase carboxyltransferase subunit alpha [Candidatus Magnetominusculus xianensis]|uniref:Acetyl-coenzyme A carboxylase carboxyl transferase subunit alpha n=1 Tax=Candidatus Magnetominusculus xianensis TaxID=1748249 RepID=A0ABR5SK31_9BACT|nr:acetyl-CoA carboxylase carboxyltransferase subunit alpha [Candidatus Magnetominusculus xianensis]KWT92950.1 acetyl-coenzyme A carboxylase carboxyl transferase subunit alpha [Candidatus Magnetominusculus xianensis]MBF0402954.1 acetyl-CoA carboxylase carboxyltransferase subunit alpha [Nitrospirota bacterium]
MKIYLDFERPIEELELKIEELTQLSGTNGTGLESEITALRQRLQELRKEIFLGLSPWQKCQLARHPERPYTLDYIERITTEFTELHGDRRFADDPAIIAGFGMIDTIPVMIAGHQKGRGTKNRIIRNFGQPHPEGYRKALRIMKLAERFNLPIVTFVDTPGAFPGIGAEERGQSEAIATNLMEIFSIGVPIISIVIGEGGSGGALALSVADRLVMLEHSVYSVISPEGCTAILWSSGKVLNQDDYARAASALKMTAADLMAFNIIDAVIEEPQGGAHRDPAESAANVKRYILREIEKLRGIPVEQLIETRHQKFRNIGVYAENAGQVS